MDGSPQLLTDVKFTQLKRGGYDPDQVDNFLERVSAAVAQLQDKLRVATERAESADAQIAEARRLQSEAEARPGGGAVGVTDADEELKKVLVLAQRVADQAVEEANTTAAQTMADARAKSVNLVAEAEQERDRMLAKARKKADAAAEERAHELHERVELLVVARGELEADIAALQAHLDTERAQIQDRIEAVRRAIDDPHGLRVADAPAVSTPTLPAAEDVDRSDDDDDAEPSETASAEATSSDEDPVSSSASVESPDLIESPEVSVPGPGIGSSSDASSAPVESAANASTLSAGSSGSSWSADAPESFGGAEASAESGSVAVMGLADQPDDAPLVDEAVVEIDIDGIDTGSSSVGAPVTADPIEASGEGDTIDLTSERLFGQDHDEADDFDAGPATQLFTPGERATVAETPADSPLGEPDAAADAAMRAFFDADLEEKAEPNKPRFGRRR